jgi:hypothetical protein
MMLPAPGLPILLTNGEPNDLHAIALDHGLGVRTDLRRPVIEVSVFFSSWTQSCPR